MLLIVCLAFLYTQHGFLPTLIYHVVAHAACFVVSLFLCPAGEWYGGLCPLSGVTFARPLLSALSFAFLFESGFALYLKRLGLGVGASSWALLADVAKFAVGWVVSRCLPRTTESEVQSWMELTAVGVVLLTSYVSLVAQLALALLRYRGPAAAEASGRDAAAAVVPSEDASAVTGAAATDVRRVETARALAVA